MGLKALLEDVGIATRIKLITDATAAKGIAARRGLGQVRHIEVSQLWLQDKVHKGIMEIEKVGGDINIADALTKYVDKASLDMHVEHTGIREGVGRHDLAPADAVAELEDKWEPDKE